MKARIIIQESKRGFIWGIMTKTFKVVGHQAKKTEQAALKEAQKRASALGLDAVIGHNYSPIIEWKELLKDIKHEIKRLIDIQRKEQTIPDFTCPDIDAVKKEIELVLGDFENLEVCENRLNRLNEALNTLEKIRDANDILRELGKDWYKICKEVYKDLSYLF